MLLNEWVTEHIFRHYFPERHQLFGRKLFWETVVRIYAKRIKSSQGQDNMYLIMLSMKVSDILPSDGKRTF